MDKKSFDHNNESRDTGACQYGNFINYYQFNSAENRVALLPSFIWNESTNTDDESYLVLDLGCNAGNLTQILYTYLAKHTGKKVYILAIDIDPILIERCNEHNGHTDHITYKCLNFMECKQEMSEYLKHFQRTTFDAVFCFSITMWIHLNNGDDGLNAFLRKISDLGDLLAVEPQPWKCYLSALRRMRKCGKNFEKFKDLEVKNNVENWIQKELLKDDCFTLMFETVPTAWNRKISFYKRIKKN